MELRDDIIINSPVKRIGTGWFIPITTKEKEIIGINTGDDLEIQIVVRERISQKSE